MSSSWCRFVGGCKIGLLVAAAALSIGGCTDDGSGRHHTPGNPSHEPTTGVFSIVAAPVESGSTTPNLHATEDGGIILSWVDPLADGGQALRFSKRTDEIWSPVKTIASGDDWFINWADFPSVVWLGRGQIAAHFLAKSGEATYAYDVFITQSSDGGETWGPPVRPHTDGSPTEHGFVSMLPSSTMPDGGVFATWLDGRNTGGHGHAEADGAGADQAMTLRAAILSLTGERSSEALLDSRMCDCCQTSAGTTDEGLIVAYRDRTQDEIRDVSVVRFVDGEWSQPEPVHNDGWQISGCPVNGPALTASGRRVAVVWFTAAHGEPAVKLAFSSDAGRSFSEAIRVDDGSPIGRVHALTLEDGSNVVSWIEQTGSTAEIRVRVVDTTGHPEPSLKVADIAGDRANGFPRMALAGDLLFVAWTDASDGMEVRLASTRLDVGG